MTCPAPTQDRQSGISLVEVVVVCVLMFVVSGLVSQMAMRSSQAQYYAERSVQLTGVTQDVIETVRKDVSGSTRFFVNDAEGLAYWNLLDRSAVAEYSATLPTLDPDGIFEKDVSGSEKTGNCLLFALLERSDTFDCGIPSGHEVRVDIFRFVAYYLRKVDGGDPSGSVEGLDLVKWVSHPVADFSQVEVITDPLELQQLYLHFYQGTNPQNPGLPYPPVRYLWKQSDALPGAFQVIASDGSVSTVGAGFKIPMDPKRTRSDLLERGGFAIASNQAGASRGLASFGLRNDSGVGFPHGFEVQIIGPASARQIMMHVTTVSRSRPELRCWGNIVGIAETRDL